ncbi:TLC domain-containing protein 2 isoform X1 [Gadus morhua]|uniref:TLC domain-containing protein 2 isoform X1 n=1 Tax=Gadus morhua TaxID=8049 RepID=UPI0011B68776|nr:TLC domain-containing protein 2-like isoform X1 [Gadus morhua]XP_030218039.1 TLC domain-containing protein 2-like isoform X1 [Gadus morhua]
MDLRSALLCVGGSVCSFKLVHTLLGGLQAPPREGHRAWRQRNIGTSLAHSSLSGAWAALCFWCHPQMAEDLISTHTRFSFSLVTLSTGYFIYDALDLLLNQSFKRSWEVLLHHAVVVSCFSLAISSRLYVGFAVLSLLVEINTVFLHIRQLMLLSGWRNRPAGGSAPTTDPPRPTPAFRLTSLLNLATWVLGVPVVYTGLDDSVAGRTSGANSSVRPHAGNGGLGRHHCHERGSSLSVAPRGSADRHTNLRKGPLEGAAHVTEPPAYFHSDDSPNEMLIGHVPPAFTIDSCS